MTKTRKTRTQPAPAPASGASRAPRARLPRAATGGVLLASVVVAAAVWMLRPAPPALSVVRSADQNVLLVTVDTLRADALRSYGGRAATPNLDRLAADGIRYAFAHAQAVVTLPSHASILTGQYPFQHGVRDNSGYRLPASAETLAGRLKARGFATGAFVGAFPLDSQFGLDTGFDVYDDRLDEVTGPADFAFSERRADAVVSAALAWIDAQPGRWFAWIHVYDPHAPADPPEPFRTQYAADPYAGEVAFTDSALGPLFDRARAARGRPTLVLVTSDHGEGLGDHGEPTHGVFAYETTLRVPLLIAQYRPDAPSSLTAPAAARISQEPVQHVDVMPTVLDALALAAPPGLPGRSLLSEAPADTEPRSTYFEALAPALNRGWAPLHGVVVGRDKYIDLPIPELYDLDADPGETRNLAGSRPDSRRLLDARLKAFGPVEPGERRIEDAETAARLRSLGYVSGSSARRKSFTEDDDPKRLIGLDRDMHRAVEAFRAGRLRDAAAIYREVMTRRPDMGIAYLHLAFLQWEMGDPAAAIETLRAAHARAGESAEIETLFGSYLSEAGRPAEALPILRRAAALPDAGVDTLNALGITYARVGQRSLAIDTFNAILTTDRRNTMALQNVGTVHLEGGDLDAAARAFEQALALNPGWAAAHTGLGVVRLRRGDRPGAIQAWTRAVELDPSDMNALFNLATELINAGRPAAARPHVERFVRTAPPAFFAQDIDRLRGWLARAPHRQ